MAAPQVSVWSVVQARLGSTRLPRKVLASFPNGPTMLDSVWDRALQIGHPVSLVIPPEDHELARTAIQRDWPYVLGHEHDVLYAYDKAARELHADHVVRVTGDCPFLDPWSARCTVAYHLERGADLTTDHLAEGRGVQVFTREALAWAAENAPPKTRHSPDVWLLDHGRVVTMKFSVDTQDDLDLARRRLALQEQSSAAQVSR